MANSMTSQIYILKVRIVHLATSFYRKKPSTFQNKKRMKRLRFLIHNSEFAENPEKKRKNYSHDSCKGHTFELN